MTRARVVLACLTFAFIASHAHGASGVRNVGDAVPGAVQDSTAPRLFIVQLRSPSIAEHHAKLHQRVANAGKPAPGIPRLKSDSAAMQSHAQKLEVEQGQVLATLSSNAEKVYSYKYAMNGLALQMSEAEAQKLKDRDEVLDVWADEVRPLATTDSLNFLELFNASVGLRSERALDGDGLVIAFIDSGVAPEHPALQETRDADRPRLCRSNWAETTLLGSWLCRRYKRAAPVLAFDPPEDWNGICQAGERFTTDDCNNKLIGARWFIDGAERTGPIDAGEIRSARDVDGHGTHTATTGAGNRATASIFGTLIGGLEGIAPKARVAVYKACWLRPGSTRAACNTSDLMMAIDAAVADGVDVINYSVGSSMREVTALDDIALLEATKAGVVSVVAAGNEGPALATIGSPAGAPWVITAAASTRTGSTFGEGFEIDAPPSIAGRRMIREASFSPPLSERGPISGALVLVDDADTTLASGGTGVTSDGCQPLVNDTDVSGNIALMQRSGCLFTEMVKNAEDAGAVAALIYNIAGDAVLMTGDTGIVDIPALMIGQADGNLIIAELDAGNEVSVTLEKSLRFETPVTGNVMASFSSRGPGFLGDVIKPDVTAPGVNIIAGFTPDAANALSGENFAYLSGTSMSAPHVAGVAALLRQAHPDWSPAAIKSALMTTARQDVSLPNTTAPPNPFDFGSGHIDPNSAFNPGLIYDVPTGTYDDLFDGTLAVDEFNLPSIAVSRMVVSETVTRQVTNVDEEPGSYQVNVNAPPGIQVSVNPANLSLSPGDTASFDVTLTYESGPMDLWRFGEITWSSETFDVRSPLAVRPASILAPPQIDAVGGSGALTIPVTFGYDGSYSAGVHGLDFADVTSARVDNDPSKTFTPRLTNGVTGIRFSVNPNEIYLRFALFDALTDGNDDLDMYLYFCGTSGQSCVRVAESGSPTSEEEINIAYPQPGFYDVYIHGFETDEVAGGPGANFDLLVWAPGIFEDLGNMTASGPPIVAAGQTADITVDWSNLSPQQIYLGVISHNTPQGTSGLTVIRITN